MDEEDEEFEDYCGECDKPEEECDCDLPHDEPDEEDDTESSLP